MKLYSLTPNRRDEDIKWCASKVGRATFVAARRLSLHYL